MDKQWIENSGNHILVFKPYSEKLKIAEIYKLCGKESWFYTSEMLGEECDTLNCSDINKAKQQVENMVINHYEKKISYYQNLLCKFKAE